MQDSLTIRVRIRFESNLEPGSPIKIIHCSMDAGKMLSLSSPLQKDIRRMATLAKPFTENYRLEKRLSSYVRLIAAENGLDQTSVPMPRLTLVKRKDSSPFGDFSTRYKVVLQREGRQGPKQTPVL